MPHSSTTYALVTAVKNEEKHLENTIRSVLQQDIAPAKWLIVNDHSTDSTGDIIQSYANQYSFIEGIESENRGERNFASKTNALRCAFQRLRFNEYSYIGNLDADITFESHFYSSLMEQI